MAALQYGEFTEMYSYTPAGRVTAKRLRMVRGQGPYNTADLNAAFTWDDEGRQTRADYPSSYVYTPPSTWTPWQGPVYTYSYDTLGRPSGVTWFSQNGGAVNDPVWVSNVSYGAAGELLGMSFVAGRAQDSNDQWYSLRYSEGRSYNARLQLTRLTDAGAGLTGLDLEYRYAAGQNNGRITQIKDWISGEEVSYQYDSLNRLSRAEAAAWGMTFSYDGFGNLTREAPVPGKTGIDFSLSYNGLTNRITTSAHGYDNNGNLTSLPPYLGLNYDTENRLVQAEHGLNGTEQYGYDGSNQRVWRKGPDGTETVYFYGPDGRRMGSYQVNIAYTHLRFLRGEHYVYFAGRLIWKGSEFADNGGMLTDRLGSVGKYYPYGEARTNGTLFATY